MEYHNIPPIVSEACETLILGSFPSVRSRTEGFYYAHPQNRFWRVLAALCDAPVPESTEGKKELLLSHRLALWDVAARCEVEGSADSSISAVTPNDLAALIRGTAIRRVYTNGGTADRLYRQYGLPQTGIPAIPLPSTSAANAALDLPHLIARWRRLPLFPGRPVFQPVTDGIFRLCVPFESLYTTVYLVTTPDGAALIDSATYPEDVRDYLLPALSNLSVTPTHLLSTHTHGDHAGGHAALCTAFPELSVFSAAPSHLPSPASEKAQPLRDGQQFFGVLRTVFLPGHSRDSAAYLDERTGTLLCGDCLQQHGIGRFGVGISDPAAYRSSLSRVRTLSPRRLVMSHDYAPLGYLAEGGEAVSRVLDDCAAYLCEERR